MAQNYIGLSGLVTQSYNQIVADITQKFMSIYGADINLAQNTSDGQWLGILAQAKKDILDLITQYYNNLDTDTAIGLAQQTLYKLNGLYIKAFSYSYVYVDVTVTQSLTLQGLDENLESIDGTGYTVSDTNGNRWILAQSVELSPGTTTLNFRSAELGSVEALPNQITIMETVISGVASVNNPAINHITGATGETAAEFRTRRKKSMAVPSQGFKESIESQMLALTNVTQCKCYENKTNTTVNNIPPHTVWTVVLGGMPQEIGSVIYANLPPGIPMKGTQEVSVSRPAGNLETIYYDIAKPADLYIEATIKNFNTTPLDEDFIKEQLAALTFDIRQTVTSAFISNALTDAAGENSAAYNITVSTDGTNWVEYATPENLDEYFTISTANITLTIED